MTGRARTAGQAGAGDPVRTPPAPARPAHAQPEPAPRGTLTSVVPGLVVLGLVGVWRVWSGSWWSLVWVVAAAVVLVVLGVWFPSVLALVVARVGSVASGVVAWVVFSLVWVLVVVMPWAVGRLSGVDPLWSPGRWVSRGSVSGRAGDLWVREGSVLPWGLRLRRLVVGLGLVGVVVGSVLWVGSRPEAVVVPAAYEGAEWYPEYLEDINWVMHSSLYTPLSDIRIESSTTRHVNVVEGRRVTWSPPPCDGCRRLRVWVYGGSTTWGAGQRDGHTIPSELARVAWEQGVVLDVENRGVGGDTHWEEARRLAWDLAGEAPPDLVVFYDGINEVLAAQLERDPLEPTGQVDVGFWQEYLERYPLPDIEAPPGGSLPPRTAPSPEGAREWAELIVGRYHRAQATSRAAAAAAGVPVTYFWQPSIEHRDPVPGEEDAGGLDWSRERSDTMLELLGPDVVDLTQVFDGVDQPLFYDGIHTNELGARLVAEAIFEHLREQLHEILSTAPSSPAGAPAAGSGT